MPMRRDFHRTLLVIAAFGTASVDATTLHIQVNGLVCAFCAQGIDKTLRALPATADVVVSLEKMLVGVELKPGQALDDATVTKAITDAGYAVVKITRSEVPLATLKADLQRGR